jgi:hypothetical protein
VSYDDGGWLWLVVIASVVIIGVIAVVAILHAYGVPS